MKQRKNVLLSALAALFLPCLTFGQPGIIQQKGNTSVLANATAIPNIVTEWKVSDAAPVNGKGVSPSGEVNGWVRAATIGYMEPLFLYNAKLTGTLRLHWQIAKTPFSAPGSNIDFKNVPNLLDSGTVIFSAVGNNTSRQFHINLLKAAKNDLNKTQSFYIRVIPLDVSGTYMLAKASSYIYITYNKPVATQITLQQPAGSNPNSTNPVVRSSTALLSYLPPIRNTDPYRFILTKVPPAGELKLVLEKMGVTKVGQKFYLSPQDYEKIKKNLSLSDQAGLALQSFWSFIKNSYNWLDNKYNYVENAIVDKLTPIVGRENARLGLNYFKTIYGLQPSYGNVDEAMGHGQKALNAYLDQEPDRSEQEKAKIKEYIGDFIALLKKEANGGDDPSHFYRQDPDYAARPAMVYLKTTYKGFNNAPANLMGGKDKITIRIYSGRAIDNSTLLNNGSNPEYPEVLLFEKTIEVPNAKSGEEITVPVYVDYTPLYTKDNFIWTRGYNAGKPGKIEIGGWSQTLKVQEKYGSF